MTLSVKRFALAGAAAFCLLAISGSAMAASKASTSNTRSLMKIHPAMRQTLHYGSRGHWVMTLQADLGLLGFPQVGPMDGIFGPKTEAGLKAFQVRHGFQATGVTSPAVWQDILAGFGLVRPVNRSSASEGSSTGTSSRQTGGLKASQNNGANSAFGSSSKGASAGPVLPAHFPNPANLAPVGEPSLPNAQAGVQGQFTASVKTIYGRPVLRAFHMVATSYGPSLQDNYPYGPVDAFGNPLQNGMVAVDPSVIPLHSILYVTGYHDNYLPQGGFLGQAMDTGGAIKGDRVDLYINANPQVIGDFGVQQVTVYQLGQ